MGGVSVAPTASVGGAESATRRPRNLLAGCGAFSLHPLSDIFLHDIWAGLYKFEMFKNAPNEIRLSL
jgi:hypothetical protein